MPTFERINPLLAYIVGLGLGAEMARSVYTDSGSLLYTAIFSFIAVALIIAGEISHRLDKRKSKA